MNCTETGKDTTRVVCGIVLVAVLVVLAALFGCGTKLTTAIDNYGSKLVVAAVKAHELKGQDIGMLVKYQAGIQIRKVIEDKLVPYLTQKEALTEWISAQDDLIIKAFTERLSRAGDTAEVGMLTEAEVEYLKKTYPKLSTALAAMPEDMRKELQVMFTK